MLFDQHGSLRRIIDLGDCLASIGYTKRYTRTRQFGKHELVPQPPMATLKQGVCQFTKPDLRSISVRLALIMYILNLIWKNPKEEDDQV